MNQDHAQRAAEKIAGTRFTYSTREELASKYADIIRAELAKREAAIAELVAAANAVYVLTQRRTVEHDRLQAALKAVEQNQ